jgi:hypothetical protein
VDRQRAAVTLALAALVGVASQYLFVRNLAGLNVPLVTALALAAAWRLRPAGVARRRDAWIGAGALVFAGLCAVRADAPLVAFDAFAAMGLVLGSVVALRGVPVTDLPLIALLDTAMGAVVATLVGARAVVRLGAPALASLAPSRSSRVVARAGGVVLAVPFLVVFGALFSSADAVFRHVVESAVDLAELRRVLAEMPARLVVGTIAAWLSAGWLAHLADQRQSLDRPEPRPVGADVAVSMLLAIDALFAVFVVVQLAYLFGGRDTLDAAGVAYSTYGRAGFFELVAVAALVAGLLFGLDLVVRARSRVYVLAALALVVLTVAVLASAVQRMSLYQAAYGWSELRFYAFVGMGYIALALGILGWAVVRGSMRIALQRLVLAALAVALAANTIVPSDFVARRNLERVIDPAGLPEDASRGLDVAYLMSLGDGALPAIAGLAPSLPEPERSAVVDALRTVTLTRRPLTGWQSWVLDREHAASVVVRASAHGVGFMR